jgi:hypothetical protein
MSLSERELLKIQKLLIDVNALRKEFGKASYEINDATAITDQQVKSIRQEYEYLKEISSEVSDSWQGIGSIIKDVQREFQGQNNLIKEGLSSYKRLQSIAEKFKLDMLGIQKMEKKEIEQNIVGIRKEFNARQNIIKALKEKAKTSEGLLANERKMLLEMQDGLDIYSEALDIAEKRLAAEKRIIKAMGLSGLALKSINGLSKKLGIDLGDVFEDALKDTREMAENLSEGGKKSVGFFGKMQIAAKGASTAMKGLFSKMTDPVFIIGGIISGLKALYNIQSRVLKQNAAMASATEGMYGGGTARAMEGLYGLSEDIAKRARELNTELGFIATKNIGEINDGMKILTEYFGLSAAEARNLFALSASSGINFSDMAEEIGGASGSFEGLTGYAVSTNKMMRTIANSSAKARFNFQGSKEQMMQTGYYASLLGMSIEDINSAARTTLDFENSIQSEIEAELMLNKDLNLEKLRYAALTGDSATQASEMTRLIEENHAGLVGNTLAQEAFAKAAGISVEQVAQSVENMKLAKEFGHDTVDVQKALNYHMSKGLSKEEAMKKLREDGVKNVIKTADAEKARANLWERTVRKFQDAFIPLADKIFGKNGENINGFADKAVEVAKMLSSVISKFVDYSKEIAIVIGALAGFKIGKAIHDAFFERGSALNPMFVVVENMGMGMGGGVPGGGVPGMGYGGETDGSGNKKNKNKNNKKNNNKKNNNRNKTQTRRTKSNTRTRGSRGSRGFLGLVTGVAAMYGVNKLMSGDMFGGNDDEEETTTGGGGGAVGDSSSSSSSGKGENFRKGAGAMNYGKNAGSFTIDGKENLPKIDMGSEDASKGATPSSAGAGATTDENLDRRQDSQDVGFQHGAGDIMDVASHAGTHVLIDGAQAAIGSTGATSAIQKVTKPLTSLKDKIMNSKMVTGAKDKLTGLKDKFKGAGNYLKNTNIGKNVTKYAGKGKDLFNNIGTNIKSGVGLVKDKISTVTSKLNPKTAVTKAKDMGMGAWNFLSSKASSAVEWTTKKATQATAWTSKNAIAPLTNWFKKNMGGVFKKGMKVPAIKSVLKRIPIIAPLLEGMFLNMDVKSALANGKMTLGEMQQGIGKKAFESIGGLVGGSLATLITTLPALVGIPSWLLTPLAYAGGDWLGRNIGGFLADTMGAKSLGSLLYNAFYKDDAKKHNTEITEKEAASLDATNKTRNLEVDDFTIQTNRKDTVALGGTNLTGNLEKKLDELINAIKNNQSNQSSNVYLDGVKVSEVLKKSSTNIG